MGGGGNDMSDINVESAENAIRDSDGSPLGPKDILEMLWLPPREPKVRKGFVSQYAVCWCKRCSRGLVLERAFSYSSAQVARYLLKKGWISMTARDGWVCPDCKEPKEYGDAGPIQDIKTEDDARIVPTPPGP